MGLGGTVAVAARRSRAPSLVSIFFVGRFSVSVSPVVYFAFSIS